MKKEKELYKELVSVTSCLDYTVTQESFELLLNKEYEMMVTQPVPVDLGNYYKSDAYISHTNANKSFLDKVYQSVRKRTLKKKLTLINSFNFSTKKILDVGAGTGDFLATCKQDYWNIFGVEPNKEARVISNKFSTCSNTCQRVITSKFFSSIKEMSFTVFTPLLLEILKSKLSATGVLIIAVPNYKSFDATYYKEFWAAFDVPRHLWHFSQTAIQKLFSNVSMKIEKTLPMKYDSYYVSLLSEKNKTGRFNFLRALFVGYRSNT